MRAAAVLLFLAALLAPAQAPAAAEPGARRTPLPKCDVCHMVPPRASAPATPAHRARKPKARS